MSNPAQAAAASHVTTIQITPVELGRVDIRIERPTDGPATIQLVAERPETLSRLIHDQSQLQQALDQAGVPQAGRVLDFSLAPPPPPDPGATSSFAGGNTNGGSFSNNGQQRGGSYANQNFGDATGSTLAATTQHRSIRSGIDITA
ncbi:MAG: flagellar hook-length control protein FliK [Janthinobacterium lividum]